MFQKLLFSVLIVLALVSCQSKDAFNFSQDIVKKEQALLPDVSMTEKKIASFIEAGKYDSVASAGQAMVDKVNKTIDEIKAMKTPDAKEADNFKNASVKYFEYMRDMYNTYVTYGKSATDVERLNQLSNIMKMAGNAQNVVKEMEGAQKKYAEANGFKISK